jgi:hypothetical protein
MVLVAALYQMINELFSLVNYSTRLRFVSIKSNQRNLVAHNHNYPGKPLSKQPINRYKPGGQLGSNMPFARKETVLLASRYRKYRRRALLGLVVGLWAGPFFHKLSAARPTHPLLTKITNTCKKRREGNMST